MTLPAPQQSDFLLYTSPDGEVKVDVFIQDETVWLTQKIMAELFDVHVPAISKHLSNIYEEGELEQRATISILETVQEENGRKVKRKVEFYNLDAIIAVGYRVNSKRATQFRIWATKTLREFIVKGFVMDDVAKKLAEKEYAKFRVEQDKTFESDFDRQTKKLLKKSPPKCAR